jgi:hypothetical protein
MRSTVHVFQALLKINFSRIQDFRIEKGDTNSKQDFSKHVRLASFFGSI